MDNLEYWLWLTNLPYIGVKTQRRLIDYFGDAAKLHEADEVALESSNILNKRQLDAIQNRSLDRANRLLERCNKLGIGIVTMHDRSYPKRFQRGVDAPVMLYYKGNIDAINLDKTVGMATVVKSFAISGIVSRSHLWSYYGSH